MPLFKLKFKHIVEQSYIAEVEADTLEEAKQILNESPFDYLSEDEPIDEQGLDLIIDDDFSEIISEDAASGASDGGGLGAITSANPSAIPGALNGSNFSDNGGTIGSGDISNPFGPFDMSPAPLRSDVLGKEKKHKRNKKIFNRYRDKDIISTGENSRMIPNKLYGFNSFKKMVENDDYSESDSKYELWYDNKLKSKWEILSDLFRDGLAYNIFDEMDGWEIEEFVDEVEDGLVENGLSMHEDPEDLDMSLQEWEDEINSCINDVIRNTRYGDKLEYEIKIKLAS